jgi:hypothetical protein
MGNELLSDDSHSHAAFAAQEQKRRKGEREKLTRGDGRGIRAGPRAVGTPACGRRDGDHEISKHKQHLIPAVCVLRSRDHLPRAARPDGSMDPRGIEFHPVFSPFSRSPVCLFDSEVSVTLAVVRVCAYPE